MEKLKELVKDSRWMFFKGFIAKTNETDNIGVRYFVFILKSDYEQIVEFYTNCPDINTREEAINRVSNEGWYDSMTQIAMDPNGEIVLHSYTPDMGGEDDVDQYIPMSYDELIMWKNIIEYLKEKANGIN